MLKEKAEVVWASRLGNLWGASLWRFSGYNRLGGDPELTGWIIYLIWPGNTFGSPRRSWNMFLTGGVNKMDGWLDVSFLFKHCSKCDIKVIKYGLVLNCWSDGQQGSNYYFHYQLIISCLLIISTCENAHHDFSRLSKRSLVLSEQSKTSNRSIDDTQKKSRMSEAGINLLCCCYLNDTR